MSLITELRTPNRYLAKNTTIMPMEKPLNVLLIDDDEVFIFLTNKLLQSSGRVGSISVSYSAMDAIKYLECNTAVPDIILLDLNMPHMNGWEFLQHYQLLQLQLKSLPQLYVVSSSISDNDAERALKITGVTGYIPKPINKEALNNILKAA